MKTTFCFILLLLAFITYSQSWTAAQLDAANTAKNIKSLTESEKAAIQYINLARLYPQLFIRNELNSYNGAAGFHENLQRSGYKKSLLKELKSRKPVGALQFDKTMYVSAKCYAKESGNAGWIGHKRRSCSYGYLAECCSYGVSTGKDIAMQWLIDDGVPGVMHRVNCLNADYSMIGIAVNKHKTYRNCAVADFR